MTLEGTSPEEPCLVSGVVIQGKLAHVVVMLLQS